MWSFVARRVDLRLAAAVAAALLLVPDQAIGQSGPPGPRPGMKRFNAPPVSNRPQVDVLDLRDRHDAPVPVTPLSASAGAIACVAGCGDGVAKIIAAAPPKALPFLAMVGPIEDAKLIKASVSEPASAAAPAGVNSGVVTCLAGCDTSDRRVMQATGGPLPVLPRHQPLPARPLPARQLMVAAAPLSQPPVAQPAAKPTAAAPIKLKRAFQAHAVRVEKRTKMAIQKSGSQKPGAQKPSTWSAQVTKPALPSIASVGAPTPIKPADPAQKPQPSMAKPQPLVSPRKPVAVSTSNDWFNKINRDQAAKKAAEPQ